MPKFKKVSADEARSKHDKMVRKSLGGSEVVIKGFKSPPSWNSEQRSARFIMTSESVDRYGDIVVQSGLDITRFLQNPQGLLFHNSRSWPCGVWSDINKVLTGRPKRTEGVLNFLPEGTDPDADRAARHVSAGSIRTVSIGFAPDWDDVEMILDDEGEWFTGWKFNKSELLEGSLVPIPAQPDALVKDAGGDFSLARDLIEEVLDTWAKTPDGLLVPMDEYRAKHLDLVGEHSFHIVKGIEQPPKTISRTEAAIKAATEEEAASFVGATVRWDPAHPENKEEPASGVFADCSGEIVHSYIVASGENKGVHALWVEWSKDGVALGMYRGVRAERVLLTEFKADEPEDAGEDQTEAFKAFLAAAEPGDVLKIYGRLVAPSRDKTIDIGVTRERPGTDKIESFEFKAEMTAEQRALVEARIAELKAVAEPENKPETPAPIVVTLSADTTEVEAAVTKVEGLFGRLAKQFPMFFPKAIEEERIEPTIEDPAPPAPPTADDIAAALAKAAGTRERLAAKGLIAA